MHHDQTELRWDGCTIVQEVSFGTRGSSFQKNLDQTTLAQINSCPIGAQGSNGDLLDPTSMNPEQLTSTPTKQDLLNEEIHKMAMRSHLEELLRENIRRDLAERMKFVPPDLRRRKCVLLARRSEQDPARTEIWLKVEIILSRAPWQLSAPVRPFFMQM